MTDGLIYLIDRCLEFPGGKVVVLRECILKIIKVGFEVGNIDALRLDQRQL